LKRFNEVKGIVMKKCHQLLALVTLSFGILSGSDHASASTPVQKSSPGPKQEGQLRKEIKDLSSSLDRLTESLAAKAKGKTDEISKSTRESVEQGISTVKNKIVEVSKQIDERNESAQKASEEKISSSLKDIRKSIDELAEKIEQE
jgi:ElaB/YqjD/DUF883 family membrane-anchored ribosome-binding protein